MTMGLAFWICMLLWLVFGVWTHWGNFNHIGNSALLFILFLLLGWAQFGAPIR